MPAGLPRVTRVRPKGFVSLQLRQCLYPQEASAACCPRRSQATRPRAANPDTDEHLVVRITQCIVREDIALLGAEAGGEMAEREAVRRHGGAHFVTRMARGSGRKA